MRVPEFWYDTTKKTPVVSRLLASVYGSVVIARKHFYRTMPHSVYRAPVPLIVVGNLTVGGTGKTPVVIALLDYLTKHGYHPGVISRGYGGQADAYPELVAVQSEPAKVGDEPVLIARKTAVPVVVDPKRKRGIKHLLHQQPQVDIIVSDDGLQHLAMARDIEILIVDGVRRFGNEYLLPAGPLREPLTHKNQVDFCLCNGGVALADELPMSLTLSDCIGLSGLIGGERQALSHFIGKPVHAVAGIGNPQRFFQALSELGLEVIQHAFPDHHVFSQSELQFNDDLPVLLTEKDAVKCQKFTLENTWVVPAAAKLPAVFYTELLLKLQRIKKG